MGVFEVFATRNSLVGNCYLESETCRKHREGPQVWYPAHRNTAHLSTYSYIPWYTTYIWVYTLIYKEYHCIYWHIKWITSGKHCTPEQLRLPFHSESTHCKNQRTDTTSTQYILVYQYTRMYFAYLCICCYILWYIRTYTTSKKYILV